MRDLTGGVGPDVTVEAAGYPDTLDTVFRLIRQFGTVVIFGVQGGDIVPVDTRTWMDNQPTIIPTTGARTGDPTTHIKNMVALKERGQVDPGRMVTHLLNFDVEDVNKAYQMYEQRLDNVLKVVMSRRVVTGAPGDGLRCYNHACIPRARIQRTPGGSTDG